MFFRNRYSKDDAAYNLFENYVSNNLAERKKYVYYLSSSFHTAVYFIVFSVISHFANFAELELQLEL